MNAEAKASFSHSQVSTKDKKSRNLTIAAFS